MAVFFTGVFASTFKHMVEAKKKEHTNMYPIGECGIPFMESQRDLGVIVSGTQSWTQQCDTVCSKAYRALYVLRRNVHRTTTSSKNKALLCNNYTSTCEFISGSALDKKRIFYTSQKCPAIR